MSRSLAALLHPKSIAVFGGQEAKAVIENCATLGFSGKIWPVHPTKREVCGIKTYSSVTALPSPPDAAFIAVNRHRTIAIVEELAKCGAGGAISYASGFTESDAEGRDLQQALVEAAGDMPVIGPNCYGLLNFLDGVALWPDQHGGARTDANQSGVAIITQSSNIAITMTMQRRGLPIAYVATAGNQAQTGLSRMALCLLDNPRVTALGLHIEGFDSIAGMEAVAAKARSLKKPVIAMKIGRSSKAREAAFSHTASIAGTDATADAFLKRIGIARLNSIPAFLETLKLLHGVGPLEGASISSISCSGGEAGLMADAAIGRRVHFRELSKSEKKTVQDTLGPMVTVANPLDYHTYIWGEKTRMEATFTAMLSAGFNLNCFVIDLPREDRCNGEDWQVALDAMEGATISTGSNSAIISTLHENMSEEQTVELMERSLVPLLGVDEAFAAIEAASAIGEAWKRKPPTAIATPASTADMQYYVPNEAEAKAMLSKYEIAVPIGEMLSDLDEITREAIKIGFPIAMKALGIAHKSEKNAVHLNLCNEQEITFAAQDLKKISDDIYIEAMVGDPVLELLVGLQHDEQFGLVMTIATGGVMVEIFADSQTLLMPFSAIEVAQSLRRLKSAVFFEGFRGGEKADFNAAVDTIMKVQNFALSNADRLIELDINPLIVCGERNGAIVADALMKFRSNNNGSIHLDQDCRRYFRGNARPPQGQCH